MYFTYYESTIYHLAISLVSYKRGIAHQTPPYHRTLSLLSVSSMRSLCQMCGSPTQRLPRRLPARRLPTARPPDARPQPAHSMHGRCSPARSPASSPTAFGARPEEGDDLTMAGQRWHTARRVELAMTGQRWRTMRTCRQ
jgi:hypothetical protein